MNLETAVSLCHKIINTLYGKSLNRKINEPWLGQLESDNVKNNINAIHKKALADLNIKLRLRKYNSLDKLIIALDNVEALHGIKVPKAAKKGQLNGIKLEEFIVVLKLVQETAHIENIQLSHIKHWHDLHQMVIAYGHFLLIRSGIEHGFESGALNSLLKKLLKEKPTNFFSSGYLADMFVADRRTMAYQGEQVKIIACYKDHLSTRTFLGPVSEKSLGKDIEFHRFEKNNVTGEVNVISKIAA